ncbi:hypothetical protein TUBRATIS_22990 [Tubulinosema ratisbonensis]|uniref:Uncharacterized protein n=1 Tax=Tubulinosema ratisbonensis TaxID=291195 RepID=A0A437AJB4_9MICR|nr:hypothetical protein TUBRATIS_22990 [Tubulinosema ratisbonensis]
MNLFSKKLELVLSDLELERKKRKPIMCKHNIEIQLDKSLQLLKNNITVMSKKIITENVCEKEVYYEKISSCLFILSTNLKLKIKNYENLRKFIILKESFKIAEMIHHLKMNIQILSNKLNHNTNIQSSLLKLANHIINLSTKTDLIDSLKKQNDYNNNLINSFSNILYQGSLENDIRLLSILDETIKIFENYENEDFLKLSVQFCLAKKYVEDVVRLKEILVLKYFKK